MSLGFLELLILAGIAVAAVVGVIIAAVVLATARSGNKPNPKDSKKATN